MTSVQKLSRIVLICRQAELLAEFYMRAFGFACIEDSPKTDPGFAELIGLAKGQVRTVSLHLGNQVISLAQTQSPGASYPGDVPGWDPLFQHFAIVVSDMTAAYRNLQALRSWTAISTDGPQILPQSSGGVTAFKFRDPEGHPLEMLAFAPGTTPAPWAIRSRNPCLGIDHSAISVADTGRSAAFYSGMGLVRTANSLNRGREQEKLDNIVGAVVEVTALAPPMQVIPHVELLCYRGNFDRRELLSNPNDVAATQLVFEVERDALEAIVAHNATVSNAIVSQSGGSRALLRDPDGHLLCLESRDGTAQPVNRHGR
ncbi:MAG: VOC family protein [Bradyrhizobiaceae bacterium]|nr:VOC family protein [Bradyrhizobiaceae bacterium]